MREKSPTVSPAATRPLSTLPLPDSQSRNAEELILTNYFTVRDGKIVSLIVIRNTRPRTDRPRARGRRAGRLAGAGPAAAGRRLDGPLRAGPRPGLPGGGPSRCRRALVHPRRSWPDVAPPGRTAGDGAAAARHLPVHSGWHALPVPR